jgi:hypothetical protein
MFRPLFPIRFLPVVAALSILDAQSVVAPTPDQPVTERGENIGNYNITNSFETGYRWAAVGGDQGMYRSEVNYGNGIRLLGSRLTVNSKDGHGRFFDEILLTTTGLGNDPYEYVNLRMQKNRLYRYDATWRSSDYYNPGYLISAGQHLMDTQRHIQDHEIRLFPQSRIQFRFGYARTDENGPALSTEQGLNNNTGSVLPLFQNVRRDWNEYRLGTDLEFWGFKLTLLHQWDYYKDDSAFTGALNGIPNVAANQISATQYAHAEPYHGSNPGWLGNLNTSRKMWALNARMTYVGGKRDFALDEFGVSLGQRNALSSFQTVVGGNARRPFLAGDFTISVFPTSRLTLTASQSAENNRTSGNATLSQLSGFGVLTTVDFSYLGIRTLVSSLDAQYRFTNRIGLFAAYEYSTRLIRTDSGTVMQTGFSGGGFGAAPPGGFPGGNPPGGGQLQGGVNEQNDHVNTGRLGLQFKPLKPLTFVVEGEVGRDNHPFLPLSDRDYHTINGRAEYRIKRLRLATAYRQVYNVNSPSVLSFHSSHSRNYNANASWVVSNSLSIDASYNKIHLDSAGSLAFFAGSGNQNTLYRNYASLFISNLHSVNVGTRFTAGKRTILYLGYNITKDTGDGRAGAVPVTVTDPIQQVFSAVQTFPLSYQSPQARISIRILPKVQWNLGWQLYRYRQAFTVLSYLPNYHANTGFTSVAWSF